MNKITSIENVNALIAAGVEESTTLEYKSDINTTSDKWKGEMAKDVSAMANANGGTIIYGVKEFDEEDKRHIPSHITPIDTTKVSKETIKKGGLRTWQTKKRRVWQRKRLIGKHT